MSSVSVNKTHSMVYWICAILLFIISFPKWFWGSAYIPTFASILLLLFTFNNILNNKKESKAGIIALVCQFVIIYINANTYAESHNIIGYILLFLKWIGFATLFLCSPFFWKKCVDRFIKLLAIMLLLAIIEHVLISFLGVQIVSPSYAECPNNPNRGYNVFLFNVYLEKMFGFFNRFFAFYDEPGVLGNIMMVLLYIQKFDLKKWYNIVFLISGLLSFSLAFYIAIIAYYVLFGRFRVKIAFGIIAIIFVYLFYSNEYVFDLLFGRLSIQDGSLAGYNRENMDFNDWFYTIDWRDFLFWGYQPRKAVVYAASWKWAFALYGIIPSLIYLFVISYPRAKQVLQKKDILLGYVLMIIIWIQRPFVQFYLYVFLILIPFIYLSIGRDQNNKEIYYDNG